MEPTVNTKQHHRITPATKAIVNVYSIIATLYCSSFSVFYYVVVEHKFLAVLHFVAFLVVSLNYLLFRKIGDFNLATAITLSVGTTVVLALFATGGWANSGYLWPLAYIPCAFFLTMGRSTFVWVLLLFFGCTVIVLLHAFGIIQVPYSAPALFNFFIALIIFIVCIFRNTTEIIGKNVEIERQSENMQKINKELNNKNLEISALYSETKDSIRAAKVIQQSLLPSNDHVRKSFSDSFIFYKPKDEVGGDFYWLNEGGENTIIAAIDCTGHGVSGALLTITAYHLLNNAVSVQTNISAAEILNRVQKSLLEEVRQHTTDSSMVFGMDISLCIINRQEGIIQFAGANSPLYIVRNGNVIQVKPDKFPLGLWKSVGNYTNNDIDIQHGDAFYIFSDGYADQIGGDSGFEKFKYPQFRKMLESISALPMNEQLVAISETFKEWKKEADQLDDLLVIGFRV